MFFSILFLLFLAKAGYFSKWCCFFLPFVLKYRMRKYILYMFCHTFKKGGRGMDNNKMTDNDEELFAAVPDTDEIKNIEPIELSGLNEEQIMEEAIASLPFGEGDGSLDSLMIDNDDHADIYETAEETKKYEDFFAEYKSVVAEMLSNAATQHDAIDENGDDSSTDSFSIDLTEDKPHNEKIELDINQDISDTKNDSEIVTAEEAPTSTNARENAEDFINLMEKGSTLHADDDETDGTDDSENQIEIDFQSKDTDAVPTEQPELPKRNINKYDAENPRKIDTIFEFIELFVFTLLAVMVVSTFFLRQSIVDGESMMQTLENGDRLIIYSFMYTPDYGDIIVFEDYSTGEKKPLVKRVIGLPGDEITVRENGVVYRNGELLKESYAFVDGAISAKLEGTWKIAEGEVFVMGDHRNDSKDSRELGPIDSNGILGKVIFRFYPFANIGKID